MWIRLDDSLHDDPRVLGLDLASFGLLIHALIWSGRQLADGRVPRTVFTMRAHRATDRHLTGLERAGLIARDGDAFVICPDLVALQPTRAEVLADREKWKERQRRYRASRRDSDVTDWPVTEVSRRDKPVTDTPVTEESRVPVPSRPVRDKDQNQEQRAGARGTWKLRLKMTHSVLDRVAAGQLDALDAREELKCLLTREGLLGDPADVTKLFESAEHQRARRGAAR